MAVLVLCFLGKVFLKDIFCSITKKIKNGVKYDGVKIFLSKKKLFSIIFYLSYSYLLSVTVKAVVCMCAHSRQQAEEAL